MTKFFIRSCKVPILDFGIISMENVDTRMTQYSSKRAYSDTDIRIRVKLNGKYFTGILEMSE
tara:strand:+ start:618 stop:803 length:186 start_codon:yes stop_codon:yes gene_type:complete